jgi:pantetheine-phosphate adenylyltransferase
MAREEFGGILEHLPDLLAPRGRAVVESGEPLGELPAGLTGTVRSYGSTVVTFLERTEGGPETVRVAVCPGSFDPVTSGHVDVITRAAGLFDHVVVAVGKNTKKGPRLSAEERARLVEKVTKPLANVSVEVMEGLLVEFARDQGAEAVVKGLRAGADFESEFQQAQLNKTLSPGIETVFIMAAPEHGFLSSSAVREIASFGGSVRGLVPDEILDTVQTVYSGD